MLILNSIILLNKLKFRSSLLFGLLGWIVMGISLVVFQINLIFFPPGDPPDYLFTFILLPSYLAIISWLILLIIILLMVVPKLIEHKEKIIPLKREILDLGTQFTRLEVKEISAKLGLDIELIKRVVVSMVNNQEIYGDYFNTTKTIAFNQQANIEQIDKLMSKYEEWENDTSGKIK